MTVQENVEYGLRVKGVARRERRVKAQEVLERVRLAERRRAASRCSSRAASGSASRSRARSSTRRRVLLLDEPLGALDLKLRQEMQVFLKALQRDLGITFVYVTHDQEEALTMSDRIAVFNEGRIEQIGTPGGRLRAPADGVRRRLRRRVERARARRAALHDPPGEDPHERGTTADGRAAESCARSSTSASVTRYVVDLDAGGRARRRSAEPRDVVAGRAGGARQARPARVEARAHLRDRQGGRAVTQDQEGTRARWRRSPPRCAFPPPASSAGNGLPTTIGKGEGQLNLIAWEGYTQPQWVKPFEKATGCKVQREVRRLVRRDGDADAPGRRVAVRHGLRVGRREPAPDLRRGRAARQRQADPGLEELHPAAASRRRTTRSTASTTASRCSGARTRCSTTRRR